MSDDNNQTLPKPILIGDAILKHTATLDEWRKNPDLYKPVEIPWLKDLSKVMGGGIPRAFPFVIMILSKEKKGKRGFVPEVKTAGTQVK